MFKIVLEGPDNSGKSSISRVLSEKLGIPRRSRITRVEREHVVAAAIHDIESGPEKEILDRTYLISDIVYEPIYSGISSRLLSERKMFEKRLKDCMKLFYITCSEDTLKERFEREGDVMYDISQIIEAKRNYDRYFDTTSIPYKIVDTTNRTAEECADLIIEYLVYLERMERTKMKSQPYIAEAICALDPTNINVATILPTPYIDVTPQENTFHMCLWQVLKDNETYMNFFKDKVTKGHFVLMDNGQAEGAAPTIEELIPIYRELKPSEAVLPDIIYNKEETLKRSLYALQVLREEGLTQSMQIMGVPQGETFEEWYQCLERMMQEPDITSIGVSKFCTPKYAVEMGPSANVRLECVHAILQTALKLGRDIQIHLLGCWETVQEIMEINTVFRGKVRSTDSGIAFVYTRNNMVFDGKQPRPDNDEIDFHKEDERPVDLGLLLFNSKNWVDLCQIDTVQAMRANN